MGRLEKTTLLHRLQTGHDRNRCLDKLSYQPKRLLTLEVSRAKSRSTSKVVLVPPDELSSWIDKDRSNGSLGASDERPPDSELATLPYSHEDNLKQVPFLKEKFQEVIRRFRLPPATPWAFLTSTPHFQPHYEYEDGCTNPSLFGLTMTVSNRGVLGMDVALSMSYDPSTHLTFGVLLGCSAAQQSFLCQQLTILRGMTRHPLLLPILLLGQHQIQLRDMTEALWEDLLDVEKSGGQSGIDVIEEEEPSKDSHIPHTMATENKGMPSSFNVKTMTNSVLGVVQLATVWESHTKTLIAGIEIIQKTTMTVVDGMLLRGTEKHVRDGAPSPGNTAPTTSQPKPSGIEEEQEMVAISLNLKESLELILQKSNGMLWDLEFMNKRAGAQMTALYNHIAQQIATAAKQDSSDMKAIAILTMAFLPATFVATFFAMPLFDFDAAEEKTVVKSRFWYYFAVTGPLTVCVLVMYWLYGLRAQKKFKGSEGRANASVVRDRQMLGERANGGASVFGAFFPASSTRAAAGADLASKVRKRSGNGSTVDLERGIKVEASHDKALG